MLYFITGASGSGKTACLEGLRRRNPDTAWHDFDEGGIPPDADIAWRHRRTEEWLREAVRHQAEGRDMGVCGGVVQGEILACPSAPLVEQFAFCLLDCDDVLRIDRIRRRGDNRLAVMETLCWAAWQRMHAADPQWRPDVIRKGAAPEMRWERWEDWRRGDPRWHHTWRLDTTDLSVEEVAERIALWARAEKARHVGRQTPPRA